MRQAYLQVVEREQLRNTAEDNKYRNGEIHHATMNELALHVAPQWHLQEPLSGFDKLRNSQDVGEVHGGLAGEMWEPQFADFCAGIWVEDGGKTRWR